MTTPIRVAIVTMDSHFGGAVTTARQELRRSLPGLELVLHAADEFAADPVAQQSCLEDIGRADIIIAGMLFLEDHIRLVEPALAARRDNCDALVCCLSAPEVMRLTRLGKFSMAGEAKGIVGLLKRLRGKPKGAAASGKGQMKMLRELPKLLRFIPGTAQDLRAYFLTRS
jgi:magnesium chelatase subunit H